jgi:hypothetical protein
MMHRMGRRWRDAPLPQPPHERDLRGPANVPPHADISPRRNASRSKGSSRHSPAVAAILGANVIPNPAGHMKGIPERIAQLQIEHFTKADPAYGRGAAGALGLGVGEPELASVK